MEITHLAKQNPWWQEIVKIKDDYHLTQYNESPIKWQPSLLNEFEFFQDCVYVLRGPRQVGKTTLLKSIIKILLTQKKIPRRCVFYFACDEGGIQNSQQLKELLETYLDFVRQTFKKERVYIFIDEITYTKDWSISIKVIADMGKLRNVFIVTTGSHAVDLKRGAERMPGRRGKEINLDKTLLPMNFNEFMNTLNPTVSKKIPVFKEWKIKDIYKVGQEMSIYDKEINGLFNKYMVCGGFPRAVSSLVANHRIDKWIYNLYRDAIIGDLIKLGKREEYFRQLCGIIFNKQTNPFDWHDIINETSIASHHTVGEYMIDLEHFFVWDICYATKTLGDSRIAYKKRKKVYFKDPFIFHNLHAWSSGLPNEWDTTLEYINNPEKLGVLVENIVGSHLKRRFNDIRYWRKDGDDEIDFMVLLGGKITDYFEVKYQNNILPDDLKRLKKIGQGFLLSKKELKLLTDKPILIIPAPYFLYGM